MDLKVLEAQAEAAAIDHVAALLQRPDQLEKLDIYKKRAERRKAAVDAMLKTAVQTQLEGVRSGILQLKSASEDVNEITKSMVEMQDKLVDVPKLRDRLSRLREENLKHRQYAAAKENLRHLFNVPATIENTHQLIVDGKLLLAHKHLLDLERARDDLMLEVHRLNTQSEYDKNLLKSYFKDVEIVAQELGNQMWYIMSRCLEAVRGADPGPQQVVTVMRIIEREQRIDEDCVEQHKATGFMPVGRPRNWKDKCMEVLENKVQQRIVGTQFEDKTLHEQWVIRYLETVGNLIVEDLRVARVACPPCFPPHYDTYDQYVFMYHNQMAVRLREIAQNEVTKKNELVQLLSWIRDYSSPNLLGKPQLQIDVNALLVSKPLIPTKGMTILTDKYLEQTSNDVADWVDKALTGEKDSWYEGGEPEVDGHRCLYTDLPAILYQMIEDQVALAKEISTQMVPPVVMIHVEELLKFTIRYKDALLSYKEKHFEDRSRFRLFTKTLVAAVNNCDICVDSTEKVKKHVRLTMEVEAETQRQQSIVSRQVARQQLLDKIDELKQHWVDTAQHVLMALYDEIMLDLHNPMLEIMTRKWLQEGDTCRTICLTLLDYNDDYGMVKPAIQPQIWMKLQFRIVAEYLRAFESRRLTCNTPEDRNRMAKLLEADAKELKNTFKRVVPQAGDEDSPFEDVTEVLAGAANVLSLNDSSFLPLETAGFVRKYADITLEQLTGLLAIRDDTGRNDAKSLATDSLHHNRLRPPATNAYTHLFNLSSQLGSTSSASQAVIITAYNMKPTLNAITDAWKQLNVEAEGRLATMGSMRLTNRHD